MIRVKEGKLLSHVAFSNNSDDLNTFLKIA